MLNKPRAWQACTSRHNFAVSGLFDLKNLEPPKNKKFLFLIKHNNSEWVYSMFSKCFPSDFVYDTGLNPFNSPDEFRLQSIYMSLKPFDELCLLYVIIHTGTLFHSTIHRWIQFTHLWTAEHTWPQNPDWIWLTDSVKPFYQYYRACTRIWQWAIFVCVQKRI